MFRGVFALLGSLTLSVLAGIICAQFVDSDIYEKFWCIFPVIISYGFSTRALFFFVSIVIVLVVNGVLSWFFLGDVFVTSPGSPLRPAAILSRRLLIGLSALTALLASVVIVYIGLDFVVQGVPQIESQGLPGDICCLDIEEISVSNNAITDLRWVPDSVWMLKVNSSKLKSLHTIRVGIEVLELEEVGIVNLSSIPEEIASRVKVLRLVKMKELRTLEGLEKFINLEDLEIDDAPHLGDMRALKALNLKGASFSKIKAESESLYLGGFKLERLKLHQIKGSLDLSFVEELPSLAFVSLRDLTIEKSFVFPESVEKIEIHQLQFPDDQFFQFPPKMLRVAFSATSGSEIEHALFRCPTGVCFTSESATNGDESTLESCEYVWDFQNHEYYCLNNLKISIADRVFLDDSAYNQIFDGGYRSISIVNCVDLDLEKIRLKSDSLKSITLSSHRIMQYDFLKNQNALERVFFEGRNQKRVFQLNDVNLKVSDVRLSDDYSFLECIDVSVLKSLRLENMEIFCDVYEFIMSLESVNRIELSNVKIRDLPAETKWSGGKAIHEMTLYELNVEGFAVLKNFKTIEKLKIKPMRPCSISDVLYVKDIYIKNLSLENVKVGSVSSLPFGLKRLELVINYNSDLEVFYNKIKSVNDI